MQAPSLDFAMTMPTLRAIGAGDEALRPLMTQWLPSRWQVVFIIDGSEPAPPSVHGSVMKKAERARPSTTGFRNRSLIIGLPTLPSRYMLPSSGAVVLQRQRPERRQP